MLGIVVESERLCAKTVADAGALPDEYPHLPYPVFEEEGSQMLTELSIKNSKAWRDPGNIRLAPITVFFGSNSAGKTSILQFLLMLHSAPMPIATESSTQAIEILQWSSVPFEISCSSTTCPIKLSSACRGAFPNQ